MYAGCKHKTRTHPKKINMTWTVYFEIQPLKIKQNEGKKTISVSLSKPLHRRFGWRFSFYAFQLENIIFYHGFYLKEMPLRVLTSHDGILGFFLWFSLIFSGGFGFSANFFRFVFFSIYTKWKMTRP